MGSSKRIKKTPWIVSVINLSWNNKKNNPKIIEPINPKTPLIFIISFKFIKEPEEASLRIKLSKVGKLANKKKGNKTKRYLKTPNASGSNIRAARNVKMRENIADKLWTAESFDKILKNT